MMTHLPIEDDEGPIADSPEVQIAKAEEAAQEAQAQLLRLAADFDNFRKRARQEQMERHGQATADLLLRLLPVLDDFHRTVDHAPEGVDEAWRKGVELTLQQFEDALTDQGLEAIQAIGTRFDPASHEAIATEESDEQPEDTVVAEVRRGYRLGDRVLRPSLVRVSRPSPRSQ